MELVVDLLGQMGVVGAMGAMGTTADSGSWSC